MIVSLKLIRRDTKINTCKKTLLGYSVSVVKEFILVHYFVYPMIRASLEFSNFLL